MKVLLTMPTLGPIRPNIACERSKWKKGHYFSMRPMLYYSFIPTPCTTKHPKSLWLQFSTIKTIPTGLLPNGSGCFLFLFRFLLFVRNKPDHFVFFSLCSFSEHYTTTSTVFKEVFFTNDRKK